MLETCEQKNHTKSGVPFGRALWTLIRITFKRCARSLAVQVGDLVRQKHTPQGVWLVTKIDTIDGWFKAQSCGYHSAWLRTNEYEVLSRGNR